MGKAVDILLVVLLIAVVSIGVGMFLPRSKDNKNVSQFVETKEAVFKFSKLNIPNLSMEQQISIDNLPYDLKFLIQEKSADLKLKEATFESGKKGYVIEFQMPFTLGYTDDLYRSLIVRNGWQLVAAAHADIYNFIEAHSLKYDIRIEGQKIDESNTKLRIIIMEA